jgi:hypothetical protein
LWVNIRGSNRLLLTERVPQPVTMQSVPSSVSRSGVGSSMGCTNSVHSRGVASCIRGHIEYTERKKKHGRKEVEGKRENPKEKNKIGLEKEINQNQVSRGNFKN